MIIKDGAIFYNDQAVSLGNLESPIKDGFYHHIAVVRQSTNVAIYVDGSFAAGASTNFIGDIDNSSDLVAGISACATAANFQGDLDELDLWDRALSPAEVYGIYAAKSLGKYSTNSLYPNFQVDFDGISTNAVILNSFDATNWVAFTNSFIATNIQTTIELAGNALGALLDNVQLVQLPFTNNENYFLPEEPLSPLIGQNPQGCWTLSVWNTRQNSAQPTNGALLGWTLQLTTSSTNVHLIVLTNAVPYTSATVPPGDIVYFGVDVPETATDATNILTATGPMNLYFNLNALPTGGSPGDVTLVALPAAGGGTNTLTTQGTPPPLVPGRRYFLGVQNTGAAGATFTLTVSFNASASASIIPLANGLPVTANVGTGGPVFYSFVVPTNAIMATFQILNPSAGLAYLYARDSLPVPGPQSFDYESLNQGPSDQFIVVTTNSEPVPLPVPGILPLPPTTWYLSVYDPTATGTVGYTILATFVTNGDMNVISLNNFANFTDTESAQPGFPTNLMYSFTVTNANAAALEFTVTNESILPRVVELALLVGDGVFPTPQSFYTGSFNPGLANQSVVIATNSSLTNLSGIWYAAVPNIAGPVGNYSITAAVLTNGPVTATPLLISANISTSSGAFSMSWNAVAGQTYQIQVSTDLANWSVAANITAQSTTATYTDAVPVNSQKTRFFRIVPP